MSTRIIHIAAETFRYFFSKSFFRNFFYNIYVGRLTSAGSVVRFLLQRKSVKRHLESQGQERTQFSTLTVNRLIPFFVGTNRKRVLVRFLEVCATISCNQKCEYCGAFSPLRKGIVPTEEIIHWLETWSKKVVPLDFIISGGEPLLHPQLETILNAARQCWPQTRLELLTNGLLLPKTRIEVLESIRHNNVQVLVAKHFDKPEYNEKFFAGISVLKKAGIIYGIRQNDKFWFKIYQYDAENRPIPFKSNPYKAWKQCLCKVSTIQDNKLYYCCPLRHAIKSRQEGVIGTEWDEILLHRPLTPDCTREELVQYLYQGVIKECCVCSENYEYTVPQELSK
jgi:organic radical activating enzyme